MADFVMPSLGAEMEAGTLVAWRKHAGDRVERGDIIAEVETDKGIIEVEVFTSGVVEELLAAEGTKVPVGTPLARIGDTELVTAAPGPAAAAVSDARERMRQAIAAAMSRSNREIPHYYVSHTICLQPALDWLERTNAGRPLPQRLVPGALLLKAVALALRGFPELNARWENDRLVPNADINVAVAISLREGGLMIPAILDTDQLSLDALMSKLTDLVERARRGQLRSSELGAGTITVTSLGERGVDGVQGVIYPPQTALVGFGTPALRPWVVDGVVQARTLLVASLAADHRSSDGHRGARFLKTLERLLTEPAAL